MNKICCFVTLAFAFFTMHAQTVILEREEDGVMDTSFTTIFEDEADKKGLLASTLYFGFPATQSETGGHVRNLLSVQAGLSFIYLYKLNKNFAIGGDFAYKYLKNELLQEEGKILPNSYYENEREALRFYTLQAGPSVHITYDPSTSKLGKYINLEGDIVWAFGKNHYTKNENEDGSITEITTRKLQYINPFFFATTARFGFGPIAIVGMYRLTEIFKPEYNYPELPVLSIGVELITN